MVTCSNLFFPQIYLTHVAYTTGIYFFTVFRYQNVLFVCGLQPDLLLLANGDETEVTAPPPPRSTKSKKFLKN